MLKALSPSGGMIMQKILEDAADKCGYSFRTIECSPNRGYTFSHADLVIYTAGSEGRTIFHDELGGDSLVRVDLAVDHDLDQAVTKLHREISFSARAFAEMRCDVEVMTSAAAMAHRDSASLLQLNYERASVSTKGFWRSLKPRWELRAWKLDARRYMARINLALATLEKLRSDWARFKPIYDRSAKDENNGVVFKYEYELCVESMATLEVTEVRSTIGHLMESLDTHSLVLASAVGAIVGAIIGALVGTLL